MPIISSPHFPIPDWIQVVAEHGKYRTGHAKRSPMETGILMGMMFYARFNCPLYSDSELCRMLKVSARSLKRWIATDTDFALEWYQAKAAQLNILGRFRIFMEFAAIDGHTRVQDNPDAYRIDRYLQLHGTDYVEAVNNGYLIKALHGYGNRRRARGEPSAIEQPTSKAILMAGQVVAELCKWGKRTKSRRKPPTNRGHTHTREG